MFWFQNPIDSSINTSEEYYFHTRLSSTKQAKLPNLKEVDVRYTEAW